MKILIVGAATLAVVALTGLSHALAQGPRPSGGNTWHGMSQTTAAAGPHYELQYHYTGHHPRWVGQWVLVR